MAADLIRFTTEEEFQAWIDGQLLSLLGDFRSGYCLGGFAVVFAGWSSEEWYGMGEAPGPHMHIEYGPDKEDEMPVDYDVFAQSLRRLTDTGMIEVTGQRGRVKIYGLVLPSPNQEVTD